jgi:hypothetical protein
MDITRVTLSNSFSILTVGEYGMRVRDKLGRNLERKTDRKNRVSMS